MGVGITTRRIGGVDVIDVTCPVYGGDWVGTSKDVADRLSRLFGARYGDEITNYFMRGVLAVPNLRGLILNGLDRYDPRVVSSSDPPTLKNMVDRTKVAWAVPIDTTDTYSLFAEAVGAHALRKRFTDPDYQEIRSPAGLLLLRKGEAVKLAWHLYGFSSLPQALETVALLHLQHV